MAMTTDQMIEEIKGMTVLDLNTLVKALEEEFGVSAAAAVAVAAAAVHIRGTCGQEALPACVTRGAARHARSPSQ